jgi:hypothetical protein
VLPDGTVGAPVRIPFKKKPFTNYFTATVRGGSPPSWTLEVFGVRAGAPNTLSYAKVALNHRP